MADEEYRAEPRSFSEINEELKAEEEQKAQELQAKLKSLSAEGKQLFSSFSNMFGKDENGNTKSGLVSKIADFVGGLDSEETSHVAGKVAAVTGVTGLAAAAVGVVSKVAGNKESSEEKTSESKTSKAYLPSEDTLQKMDDGATKAYNSGKMVKRMQYTFDQTSNMSEQELLVAAQHGFVSPEDSQAATRLNHDVPLTPYINKTLEPTSEEIKLDNDGFFDAVDIKNLAPNFDASRQALENSKISQVGLEGAEAGAPDNFIDGVAQGLKVAAGVPEAPTKDAIVGAFNNANADRVAKAEAMKNETVKEKSEEIEGPAFRF